MLKLRVVYVEGRGGAIVLRARVKKLACSHLQPVLILLLPRLAGHGHGILNLLLEYDSMVSLYGGHLGSEAILFDLAFLLILI